MSDASPKLVLSMTAETLEKMIADAVAAAMGGGNQQATSSAALARSENAASTAHAHTSGDNLAEPASPGAVVIAETKSDTVAERKAGMADLVALESFGATTELLQELQGTAHAQNTAHAHEAIATIAVRRARDVQGLGGQAHERERGIATAGLAQRADAYDRVR